MAAPQPTELQQATVAVYGRLDQARAELDRRAFLVLVDPTLRRLCRDAVAAGFDEWRRAARSHTQGRCPSRHGSGQVK